MGIVHSAMICDFNDFTHNFVSYISVNGGFTNWTFWSGCSATCGDGVMTRTRDCTHPPPSSGGADCIGKRLDVQDCQTNISCPGKQSI